MSPEQRRKKMCAATTDEGLRGLAQRGLLRERAWGLLPGDADAADRWLAAPEETP